MSKSLTDTLEKCRLMIPVSAADDEIKTRLLNFGYEETTMVYGAELLEQTNNSFSMQNKESVEKKNAIDTFQDAREGCEDQFIVLSKLTPVLLRNVPEAKNVLPDYPLPVAYNKWKQTVGNFYTNILNNEAALGFYSKFGYTSEKIQGLLAELDNAEALMNARTIETGEAQTATQRRDILFAQLKAHCSDLRIIAKLAMADEPQLLEKMGILVRN